MYSQATTSRVNLDAVARAFGVTAITESGEIRISDSTTLDVRLDPAHPGSGFLQIHCELAFQANNTWALLDAESLNRFHELVKGEGVYIEGNVDGKKLDAVRQAACKAKLS